MIHRGNFQAEGGEKISNETTSYIGSLLQTLLDGIERMIKTDDYRNFIKKNDNFKYSDDVMAKIKVHNPAYTKLTTAGTWDKVFGRTIKKGEKPFSVNITNNQPRQLYDISQTMGKSPPALYQNISGKVEHYQDIWDCLTAYAPMPVVVEPRASYYSGVGQDSFVQDGKIILRSALSEQQTIFALVREIVWATQTNALIAHSVIYMVCRHINIDIGLFSCGYILELLGFDESLETLKNSETQGTIRKEAKVFIGYLNAKLTFLQGDTEGSSKNGSPTASNETSGNAINPPIKHNKEPTPIPSADKADSAVATKMSQFVEIHTERVNDIDFRFVKIIREYASTLPDKSINLQAVWDYGYYDTKMHPISFNVASRLLSTGREIYKLHKDNTEQRINTIEEAKKHSGYFGISKDEWATAQVQIIKDGVDGAINSINRWSRVISPESVQEAKKRKMERDRQEALKTKQAQAQSMAADNQAPVDNTFIFDDNGGIIIVENDVSYSAIENQEWLETALLTFFKQTRFKTVNMPFFSNSKEFTITAEMKKINSLMGSYCASYITSLLQSKNIKQKNPKTGKVEYKVRMAVELVCNGFAVRHITYALNELWPDIKVPGSIKKAFESCFETSRKNLKTKPKKESPDEQFARLKVAEDAKVAVSSNENSESSKDASVQKGDSERNAEIYHIIESYKKGTAAKPKKPPNALPPILPPMPTNTARKSR